MCLILKVDKPLLCYSVYCDRHHDAARIYLIGYFHILELSFLLQLTHCKKCNIHEAYELVISALEDNLSVGKVTIVGINNRLLVISIAEAYILKLRGECGMTTMVRPVCIKNTDFRHGRVTLLLIFEIILYMLKIFKCHGKTK